MKVAMPQHRPPTETPPSRTAPGEFNPKPRLSPPRSTSRLVVRERLLNQLLEARRKRCIVVQGPAGCGKTTTLTIWREELLLLGFDVPWLTLTAEDNDMSACLGYLVASLTQVDPALTREAALLGGRGSDAEAVERTLIALVSAIASYPNDLMLILDDFHLVADNRVHEAFQWLLDYAPPNLHLALATRTTPSLSLGRLRDQGLLLELDMRDLRFTLAESEAFLKTQIANVGQREARRLHELTDGWIAGLQLLAIGLKKNKQVISELAAEDEFLHPALRDAPAFADYFQRQILSRLLPLEVELLVRMSACTRMCPSLCEALIADAQHATGILPLLSKLAADNFFIAPLEQPAGVVWYRLNPLFRETLLARLRSRSEAQQRDIHRAAWLWFRDHGHPDEAVRHALLAGEPGAAADLVQQVARDMQRAGSLRKLVRLMRLLPAAEIQARPGLQLWTLQLDVYARDFDACAATIARLKSGMPAGDARSRYRLVLLEGAAAVQRDDIQSAINVMPELLVPPANADGWHITPRNGILAWIYLRAGKYEEARRIQEESAQILVDGAPLLGTSGGVLSGRCIAGFSHAMEGNFAKAERIGRDVLFEAEKLGAAAIDAACIAAGLLGEVHYEANQLRAARKLLEDRVDVLERISIPESVLRVLLVLSAAHWVAGHQLDAFAYIERLEEYASRYGVDRLLVYSLAEQVRRHLQSGQFDTAHAILDRLDAVALRYASSTEITSAEIRVMSERARIDWCIAKRETDNALERLAALIAQCEAYGWQRHVAQFQMLTALVEFQRGGAKAARQNAIAALRNGHRLGLIRSILDVDADVFKLIDTVMSAEPVDPVLNFYVQRLRATGDAAKPDPLPSDQAGKRTAGSTSLAILSERESKVVRLLGQALPNKKIARTLGISPETVKWHLKNIYSKLGVSCRDEAVKRMRDVELGEGGGSAA
ncbi:LuxR C-terminal-related transcriptional regulator [Paraburkholderia azotifigens]|uniref:LuxR C-terminal-related transcriptional regulator n=1 Tax=Paraburkholderia azotifigens TaxID=2057004 RepID=UPI003177DD36